MKHTSYYVEKNLIYCRISFYRCVSDRFGIGRATAWRSVHKVVSALYFHLHTFIKWPSAEEAKDTWTFIKRKYGFPKVIGAIDGTHVHIAAPKINAECYVNRKGYHSVQLQVQKYIHTHTYIIQIHIIKSIKK